MAAIRPSSSLWSFGVEFRSAFGADAGGVSGEVVVTGGAVAGWWAAVEPPENTSESRYQDERYPQWQFDPIGFLIPSGFEPTPIWALVGDKRGKAVGNEGRNVVRLLNEAKAPNLARYE